MPDPRRLSRALLTLALPLSIAAGQAGAAGPATRPATPRPIGIAVEGMVTARVVEVDPTARVVVLRGPAGDLVVVDAGDRVENFDQIHKGDTVTFSREAVLLAALEPVGQGASAIAETVEQTARAGEGDKPGFVRARTTKVVANVIAVDQAKRTLTFRGPRQTVRTVKVTDPSIDLSQVKVGQAARIVYREVDSVMVTAPAANP